MFNIGQEVIIEVFKEHIWQKYKSKIMDVSQEILFIAYPVHMETNKILYLSNGKQVKVSFVDEDEQAYEFISLITGKKKDTIPLLKIIKPRESDIVNIQRRQFLRINWAIDIAVHAINSEFPPFTTVTSNISAGGMSIIVNKQIHLKLGQEILCWLVLPRTNGTYHYLKIKCKVIRIQELNQAKHLVSLEFVNKTEQEEQMIIRFCYEAQVMMKKKKQEFSIL